MAAAATTALALVLAGCAADPEAAPAAPRTRPAWAVEAERERAAEARARVIARAVFGEMRGDLLPCLEAAVLIAAEGVGRFVRTPHHAVIQVDGEGGPVYLDPANPGAVLTRAELERAHPWPANEAARRLYGVPIGPERYEADLRANDAANALEAGNVRLAHWLSTTALRIEPDLPEALVNLGAALVAAGRPEEALEPLARAADVLPGDPAVLYNRGVAAAALGRREEALAFYDEVLRVAPGHEKARANRAALTTQ